MDMLMDETTVTETVETPEMDAIAPDPAIDNAKVAQRFKARAQAAAKQTEDIYPDMKRNVEWRLGKVSGQMWDAGLGLSDEMQSSINPDWSLTKTKTANLYSQVPHVQIVHENKQYAPAIPPFSKAINFELSEKRANIGVAMEEVLNDVVNAAGVGAIIAEYSARFEMVEVPSIDIAQLPPEVQMAVLQQNGGVIPTEMVPRPVSDKFTGRRVSPKDLLWPCEFTGSSFDEADWVGYKWKDTWAVAKNEYKLRESVKDDVVGATESKSTRDLKSTRSDQEESQEAQLVSGKTLFYWRYRVDPEEKSFQSIWKIVFVDGMDEPVVHEAWKGQEWSEEARSYVGAIKFPLRFLTLTYITDNPVPPSDSQAGRPQVMDLRRSRSQMFANRARSTPIRGYDTNRIDPMIQDRLSRGEFQDWIPVNGNAERAIWEVARASYPAEDFTFDQMTMKDLERSWLVGENQQGISTGGTAKEAEIVQSNTTTRLGQERAKVSGFFLSVVEVIAGLMALYSDFPMLSDAEIQQMEAAWDRKNVPTDFVFKIRPDSTIMIEAKQRRNDLLQVLSMVAKSGFVNPMPIIVEILELSGLDPAEVMKQPEPPKPEEASMSFSFSGKDDLTNPVVIALMMKAGRAPSPQEIEAAKKLLAMAQAPAMPSQPPQGSPQGPPPPQGVPDNPQTPPGANEDWNLAPRISKRSRDMNPGG